MNVSLWKQARESLKLNKQKSKKHNLKKKTRGLPSASMEQDTPSGDTALRSTRSDTGRESPSSLPGHVQTVVKKSPSPWGRRGRGPWDLGNWLTPHASRIGHFPGAAGTQEAGPWASLPSPWCDHTLSGIFGFLRNPGWQPYLKVQHNTVKSLNGYNIYSLNTIFKLI